MSTFLRLLLVAPLRLHKSVNLPFVAVLTALHLLALCAFVFVPITWTTVALFVGCYLLRGFGICAGYHRYFAHRSFQTSRLFRAVLACMGCTALQNGPLTWTVWHREHHNHTDEEMDPHSPVVNGGFWQRVKGFLWAHIGWMLFDMRKADKTLVNDFSKYWELRLIDRLHFVPPFLLAVLCGIIDGWSGVFWAFFVGTVALYHVTFCVNSVCHIFGTREFATKDKSRNNVVIAWLTLGEGWHNTHHAFPYAAKQSYKWWQIDMTYLALCLLQVLGIVYNLKVPSPEKVEQMRIH